MLNLLYSGDITDRTLNYSLAIQLFFMLQDYSLL
jgi:hypothetical protein